MTRPQQRVDWKRDKKITENEAGKILAIYTFLMKKNVFVAKDVRLAIPSLGVSAIQRFLWIGREMGLFSFKVQPCGNVPAIYQCVKKINVHEILSKHIAQSVYEIKAAKLKFQSSIGENEQHCMLADILGYTAKPHIFPKVRKIEERHCTKTEKSREKVFVSGEWRL